MHSRTTPASAATGSFPLLEHVVLLRAELSPPPRVPQAAPALATLIPIQTLTTPPAPTSPTGATTVSDLLESEPALRALLLSFTTERMQCQQRRRWQSQTIHHLYTTLEAALDGVSAPTASPVSQYAPGSTPVPTRTTAATRGGEEGATSAPPRTRPELEDVMMKAGAARANPWSLLPVSKEGVYIQVPSRGFGHACRDWAAQSLQETASVTGAGVSRTAASVGYSDTAHYFATRVAPTLRSSQTTTALRARNDEGYLYGYAMYMHGDLFFPDLVDSPAVERGLVLCVTSTSPVLNFARRVVLEMVQQLCSAAKNVVAAAANSSTPTRLAALMLAVLSQVLEPMRELTDPRSPSCLTPPGRPFALRLALPDDYSSSSGSGRNSSHTPAILQLKRPADLLYPYLDTPLAILLLSFPYAALRVLHSLLLQEARVVIIGATAQHAAACTVAAPALTAPLTWVSPIIPYAAAAHLAGSGVLETLLAPSAEMAARRRHARQQGRAVPTTCAPLRESAGFLIGATPALVPQLMLRLSAVAATAAREEEVAGGERGGGDGRQPAALERARVWVADARTGNIGVVPLEPLSLMVSRVSAAPPPSPGHAGEGGVDDHARASPAVVSFPTQTEFQRHALKQATSQNAAIVSSLAVVDVLPVGEKLKAALNTAVSVEKRTAFRVALEAMAVLENHRGGRRDEEQERLEDLLRAVQLNLDDAAAATERNDTPPATGNDDEDGSSSDRDGGGWDDRDTASVSGSVTASFAGSGGLRSPASPPSGALAPFGRPHAQRQSLDSSRGHHHHRGDKLPATTVAPAFPSVSTASLVGVHAALLDYNTQRLFGHYRRGMVRGGSGVVAGFNFTSLLPLTVSNSFRMAEAVGQTHAYQQFEHALACAEGLGLSRVLRGDCIPAALTSPLRATTREATTTAATTFPLAACNYHVSHPRMVSLLNLFVERSRRRFPELFPELSGTTPLTAVYSPTRAAAFDGVENCLRIALAATAVGGSDGNRNGGSLGELLSSYRVPALAFLAGYEETALEGGLATSLASGGGGGGDEGFRGHAHALVAGGTAASLSLAAGASSKGGGVRGFLAKATRAVKQGLTDGGGGGSASSTTHVITILVAAYVQAAGSFAAGGAAAMDRRQLRLARQRRRRSTHKRLEELTAKSRGRRGRKGKRGDGEGSGGGGGGGGGERHHRRRSTHAVSSGPVIAHDDGAESEAERRGEEQAALADALAQADTLRAGEFVMPEVLGVSDQALLLSATAAAVGVDGVALGSNYGAGAGGAGAAAAALYPPAGPTGRLGTAGYVAREGVENEFMRLGARGGALRSPTLCRPLPLDVVHHFASYHPLLGRRGGGAAYDSHHDVDKDKGHRHEWVAGECPAMLGPVCDPNSVTGHMATMSYLSPVLRSTVHAAGSETGSGASVEGRPWIAVARRTSPHVAESYALMGSLCPWSATVWRTTEELAEAALLNPAQAPPPPRARPLYEGGGVGGRPPATAAATAAQAATTTDAWTRAAAPSVSVAVPSVTTRGDGWTAGEGASQRPATATATATAAAPPGRALFDALFATAPTTTTSLACATDAGGLASWGTFTSGVPEGFPVELPSTHAETPAGARGLAGVGAPRRADDRSERVWEGWGLSAPVAEIGSGGSVGPVPAPGSVMDELLGLSPPRPKPGAEPQTLDDYFR